MRSGLMLPLSIFTLLWPLPFTVHGSGVEGSRVPQGGASKGDTRAPAASEQLVEVRPTTLVLHGDVLAGLRVFVPAAQVVRVIGPRLVVVTESRVLRAPIVRPELEELLLALPGAADVAVGDVLQVVGRVRTIAGVLRDAGATRLDGLDPALKSARYRRATLLAAESMQTLDGVDVR